MTRTDRWVASAALLVTAVAGPAMAKGQEAPLSLSDAVLTALESDPSLAAALAREEAAEADASRAAAARLPTLDLEGTVVRFQEPMVVAPLHSFDPSSPPRFDDALVQGAARLRYTAFDGGRVGAGIRAARSAHDATVARATARRMDVIERVTEAYLAVLGARAHQQAANGRMAALEAEYDRARQRVETGSAADVELLRAAAALEEARATSVSARTRTELAERSLARAMEVEPARVIGRTLTEVDTGEGTAVGDAVDARETAGVDDPADREPGRPAVGDGRAIPTHPEVRAAMAYERAATERLDGERAARLPRLNLTAALLDYGTWSGAHVAEWQVGVSVSWPAFTGGARTALIRRTEAELAAARQETEAVTRSIEAGVDAARSAILEADARTVALTASVRQWAEVARIEALALEAGAGTQSDLLAAEASLFRARAGLAEATYARLLARARLARAEGRLDLDWLRRTLEGER